MRNGFDRSRVRALALFSCSDRGLWEVVPLPARVRSRVVVNDLPAVGQLEAIAEERCRFGVLLVDRQRTRMFIFELDELVETTEAHGELPRDYDTRGEQRAGRRAGPRRRPGVDPRAQRGRPRLRLASRSTASSTSASGCPDDMAGEVEGALHPYLRRAPPGPHRRHPAGLARRHPHRRGGHGGVRRAGPRGRPRRPAARHRSAPAVGPSPVCGPVLGALAERRVDHLIVSHEYEQEGWRCRQTGALHAVRPRRDEDPASLHHVEDVVEEAIDDALGQGAKVEICVASADLDVHGRIGALLRY